MINLRKSVYHYNSGLLTGQETMKAEIASPEHTWVVAARTGVPSVLEEGTGSHY